MIAGGQFAFIISWITVEMSIFNSTAEVVPIPVYVAVGAASFIDALVVLDKAATG